MATFTLKIIPRPRQPRSKRLKAISASAVTLTSTSSGTTASGSGTASATHKHSNLTLLERLSNSNGSYLELDGQPIHAGFADTAADLTEDSPVREEFLSSHDDDKAKGHITFEKGLTAQQQANLSSAIITEFIRSPKFVSGITGEGLRIGVSKEGESSIEVDRLTVRGVMNVLELIIQKTRAVAGQLVISPANGRIKSIIQDDEHYIFSIEDENGFQAGDLIMCQVFGERKKYYWVEVYEVSSDAITVMKSEFEAYDKPAIGDDIVTMGNATDKDRQAVITISATESSHPHIDVLNGISSKNFNNALRARIGCLDGINDAWLHVQPKGYGIYTDNAYLRGTFVLDNDLDVKTLFQVTEGKVTSQIDAMREDYTEERGFLANPSFSRGLDHWSVENQALLYTTGQTTIISRQALLASAAKGSAVTVDNYRTVIRISNSFILEKNEDLRDRPVIISEADGNSIPALVHLSVFVKVVEEGTLDVYFENEETEGFEEFTPFEHHQTLQQTEGYTQVCLSGLWTGTGDFRFQFSGTLLAYMFLLTSDPVEAFSKRYQTLFEQSERLVKLSAAVYGDDKTLLKKSGLVVSPGGSGIYMQTKDGDVALIGVGEEVDGSDGKKKTVIKLTGDNIKLEGMVTANGNFNIRKDGSIEAKNAKLEGYMYSNFKPVSQSDATYVDGKYILNTNLYIMTYGEHIVLPSTSEYEGARVIIMNCEFRETRTVTAPTTVTIQQQSSENMLSHFVSGLIQLGSVHVASKLEFKRGAVELIMSSYLIQDGIYVNDWVILNQSCDIFKAS